MKSLLQKIHSIVLFYGLLLLNSPVLADGGSASASETPGFSTIITLAAIGLIAFVAPRFKKDKVDSENK